MSLTRELFWAAARTGRVLDLLLVFLSYRRLLSSQVLLSRFAIALQTLDELEERVGKSIWGIKLRIALLQKSEGLEVQKKFTATVRQLAPTYGFVQYLARHVSTRNEAAMTPPSFRSSFRRHLAETEMPVHFKDYALYHILPDSPLKSDQLASILNLESAASVVDHYESVMSLAPYINLHVPSQREALSTFLQNCAGLPDTRIAQSLIMVGRDHGQKDPWLPINIVPFDQFLAGSFDLAYENAVAELISESPRWDFIELAGRSLAAITPAASPPSPAVTLSDVIQSVRLVCSNAENSSEDVSSLSKFALNFAGLSWSDHLFGFLAQVSKHDPLEQHSHCSTGLLYVPEALNPLRVRSLPGELRPLHAQLCLAIYGNGISTRYSTALAREPVEVMQIPTASPTSLLFNATASIFRGSWKAALDSLDTLANEESAYFRKRGVALRALALLRSGDLGAALRYTTSEYVKDSTLSPLLPIAGLTEQVSAKPPRSFSSDISVPVLLDMYCRHVGPGREADRQYSIEDFLAQHGLKRPSELGTLKAEFENAKLIYFLRVVCLPANMDESTAFSGTPDLENERISICLLLEGLDPGRQDVYQTEVKEITRRQVIQRGIRQVEMSKIYVDVNGVRSAAEATLRESFNRYIAFEESGVQAAVEEVLEALRKVTKEGERSLYVALKLPENEKSAILREMVGDFRDIFVSSTEHGLDGYLSTRIRHGTLSGQLRSPLQAARLVTQRDADSGRYRANDYWAERIDLAGSGSGAQIGAELATFSERFDSIVNRINAEWLRIRRYDEDNGQFDFRVGDPLLRVIASHLSVQGTFEEFVDILVTYMWKMLDESLELIRAKLSQDLKAEIDQLLLQLQSATQDLTLASGADTADLERTIVTARTEMQRTIARITDWFRLPTQTPNRPYQFRLAIDIAVETINKYYRAYSLSPTVSAPDDLVLPGVTLPALVDVFFILLENIVKHSHTETPPEVRISTSAELDIIHIAISNDVASGVANAFAKSRLVAIRGAIAEGDYLQSVPREGGTGFHKIRKIVAHDLGELESLDFGFAADDQFLVQIAIRPDKLS